MKITQKGKDYVQFDTSRMAKARRCQILLMDLRRTYPVSDRTVRNTAFCSAGIPGTLRLTSQNYLQMLSGEIHKILLPISLVMLGGWLIDREAASDTLKNIAVIPIPASKLLLAKLLLTAFCALLFGCCGVLYTADRILLSARPGFSSFSPAL